MWFWQRKSMMAPDVHLKCHQVMIDELIEKGDLHLHIALSQEIRQYEKLIGRKTGLKIWK
jgi:hypothetical protein